MLHSISWQAFFTTLALLLLIYWAFIGLSFYRHEIKLLLAGKGKPGLQGASLITESPFEADIEDTPVATDTGLFPIAYALAEEIKQLAKEAGRRRLVREELMQALQSLIKKQPYPSLSNTAFRIAINNLVEAEIGTNCSIQFSKEELQMLWP